MADILAQLTEQGGGWIYLDQNGDKTGLEMLRNIAQATGRANSFYSVEFGAKSGGHTHSYSPLARGSSSTLASCMSRILNNGALESPGAAYYHQLAKFTFENVIAALRANNQSATVETVADALAQPDGLDVLAATLPADSNVRTNLVLIPESNPRYAELGRMLRSAIAPFIGDLCSPAPEVDLLRALQNNQMVYIALPVLEKPVASAAVMRMFNEDLVDALHDFVHTGPVPDLLPFVIALQRPEDFGSTLYREGFPATLGKAGVALTATLQGLGELGRLETQVARNILSQSSTTLLFAHDTPNAESAALLLAKQGASISDDDLASVPPGHFMIHLNEPPAKAGKAAISRGRLLRGGRRMG